MFEKLTIQETVKELQGDEKNGLTDEEARIRLDSHGRNVLREAKKTTVVGAFFEQLNDPLIYVLLAATVISILLGEISDAAIIVTVIVLNAVVGVIQEGKAQKALDALKKLTSPRAVVKRGGKQMEIAASELVPGDLVFLDAGRQVPADLRLLDTVNLKIEESALTGETVPVEKDAHFTARGELSMGDRVNMAYMSTVVTYGRGEGIVTNTGMDTEIGKIAAIINEAPKEMTPLQRRLGDLGKLLSIVAVVLCVALFGIALLQKRDVADMFLTAISLAVAAVPEGLPAVVTIVLALSVSKMVKVNTIVRRLPSVETLGAVSIVCSDKTGTLTQNKMTVAKCFVNLQMMDSDQLNPDRQKEFLEGMTLCNDGVCSDEECIGEPTELALLELSGKYHIRREQLEKAKPRTDEKPFDSKRKMMTTQHRQAGGYINYTKGAPDEVLKRCTKILLDGREVRMTDVYRRQIEKASERMSAQALRVLAVSMKKDKKDLQEKDLTFIGLTGMIDPPRPEAAGAVEKFRSAGVTTVMITGDHVDTAFAIARDLGIAREQSECLTGPQLSSMTDAELADALDNVRVFARVSPEHKVRIVKALKAKDKIVAMTGDGVNDAPSLKTADIGIAMGVSGTDVAKNASDIILTDDNFATIERAIEEGRGIYENIKKSVLFLLSSNFGEIITMFLAIIAGLASPLKASHILWVNLITDSLPALALGVDENDREELMENPPRDSKESLFAGGGLACTLFYGCLIGAVSLTAFLILPLSVLREGNMAFTIANIAEVLKTEAILNRSQTYAFTVLCLSELFHAVGMRDVAKSVFRMNHLSNKLMIGAFVMGFVLQAAVTEIPALIGVFGTVALSFEEWGNLIFLAAFPLLAHEIFVLVSLLKRKGSPKAGYKAAANTVITYWQRM
ncbi:cation-translocating P-type ATPase [Murimonas intestini]|uniref:cation-translocating P-type ATPase n=1 Tax=Murimonas intestini TaxID=1337051 RepID=UPI0011DD71F3|nr:cation-translocating P-type ATPase [Murimonas intestini]